MKGILDLFFQAGTAKPPMQERLAYVRVFELLESQDQKRHANFITSYLPE
jgi:hypothetical protein